MTIQEQERNTATSGTSEERISWFPLVSEAEMDPEVRALCEKALANTGSVPNVFRAYAWRPDHFLKWFAHFRLLLKPTPGLSAADRELIGTVVSAENRCLYCLTAHGLALRELLADPVLADRIALDYRRAGLDEKRRAMCDYAAKLTRTPVECDEADIERLRAVGFSDEDIWDIAEVAAMFNFSNRMASATGMMPNREYHGQAR